MRKTVICLLALLAPVQTFGATTTSFVICRSSKGVLIAKAKCAKGETRISAANLGTNYSTCHQVLATSGDVAANQPAEATTSCPSGEFVIARGLSPSTNGVSILTDNGTYPSANGDGVPPTGWDAVTFKPDGDHTLNLFITCCKQ